MSSPIFLKPGMTVNMNGRIMTYEEIKEAKIDSVLYRKHLKRLMSKREKRV